MPERLPPDVIKTLRKYDSPTLANAIEHLSSCPAGGAGVFFRQISKPERLFNCQTGDEANVPLCPAAEGSLYATIKARPAEGTTSLRMDFLGQLSFDAERDLTEKRGPENLPQPVYKYKDGWRHRTLITQDELD